MSRNRLTDPSRRRAAAALGAIAIVLGGCGGQAQSGSEPKPRGPVDAQLRAELARATSVSPGDFPPARGRTIQAVSNDVSATGPQLAFATSVLRTGKRERLAFGLLDGGKGFLYAPTVIYVAPATAGAKALGPFEAPADLLVTDTPFRSQTAATEDSSFAGIYTASVPFRKAGSYNVLAVSKINGQDVAAGATVKVIRPEQDAIPGVGDRPPAVATDTVASAGGDIKSIDTRRPTDDMHEVSFKDVVGRKPTVLLFATPQLCQSRVCGPVVDIAEQLKRTYGDRVQFIHQEVYADNTVSKGLRPPLRAFDLQTEPWLFAVNRQGRITARLEGSFGFNAFTAAVKSALE